MIFDNLLRKLLLKKRLNVKTVNHQANRVTLAAVNTRVFHPAFQAQQTDMDAAKAQAALIAKEANSDEVRSRLCCRLALTRAR